MFTPTKEKPARSGKAESRPARKRNKLLWAAVVVCAGLLVFLLIGFFNRGKQEQQKSAPKPVMTVSVEAAVPKVLVRTIAVNGSVTAWDPVAVSAAVSGLETKQVLADEGYTVRKGQILAILDDSQIRPQLESERARLRADIGNLRKSVQPNRVEDIAGLEAAVAQASATVQDQRAALEQAKANLDDANIAVKRYHLLATQGAVSAEDYDTRATNAKVARAAVQGAEQRARASEFALRQAKEKLAMARAGGRREDIDIAKANADQTKSAIDRLSAQLAQTQIRTPVDGLVTKRDVHIGDVSTSGKTMFYIMRDSRLELRAQVPEADLSFIKPGQQVTITSSLAPSVTGTVREISPLIDAATRLATVRIDIPFSNDLKPGSYAEGQINAGQYSAIAVPASSVISKDDISFVFVLNGDRVVRKTVTTGTQSNNLVEIKSGLAIGDRVVVKGAGFLKDQDVVAVGH